MTAITNRLSFRLFAPVANAPRVYNLELYDGDAINIGFNCSSVNAMLDTTVSSATFAEVNNSTSVITIGTPTTTAIETEALVTTVTDGEAVIKVTVTMANSEIVVGYINVLVRPDPQGPQNRDYQ